MADMQKALETQLKNIETKSGRSLDELVQIVRDSGLAKHSEIVAMLKTELGLGYGDANAIAHYARQAGEPAQDSVADPLDALYAGPKAQLRAIHEALLGALSTFGPYDVAPKQKYVSYRRNKQFAMIGPGSNTRVDVGLNIKELPASPRLEALPAGQMCNYRVKVTAAEQVDAELVGWVKLCYDNAG